MNAIQKRYAAAVAANDAHHAEARALETAILDELHLAGANGDPVEYIWAIDDEATFKSVSDLHEAALLASGYYARQSEILDELNAATDALVEWGLDLFGKIHPKEAQPLRNEAKRSYTQRKKIADYAFRLDVSTIGGIA